VSVRDLRPGLASGLFYFPLYHGCQMRFHTPARISAFLLCAFCMSAFGQKTQPMLVTALEYRKNVDPPYRLEGETLPPQAILHYVLDCRKGAADLHVGNSYEVQESTDEDRIKTLLIYYRNPNDPSIIGVFCTVISVKAKK